MITTDRSRATRDLEAHQGENRRTLINGIDVGQLGEAIEAIQSDPANAMTTWQVRSEWAGGTRSDHHIEGFHMGGQFTQRSFTVHTDEPQQLTGSDQYASPTEHLLAALNACMMVGYAAVAGMMGINLTKLEVHTAGDIDLRGFLGLDKSVPNGYPKLEQEVRIAGDGTPGQFAELHEAVQATSPNFHNITHAIQTNSRMVVE